MKKLLALVLALVMSMSLVTISNAAFKDADKIDYKEAVDVMNAVGVFVGDEKGNFNAKENLTREQAAKIIAYLELGSKAADALVGGATFTDVASSRWSAGFVGYCAQAGIVSGVGDSKFDPAGQLTALQFGKMLLVELGYDAKAAGMVGTDWAINTSKLMATAKLMDGIDGSVNQVLTREKAAQMCLNALEAPMVTYENKGSSISINGTIINIGGSSAKYKTSTIAKDQNISKEKLTSGEYTVELGEKLYKDLKQSSTDDDFGRPATKWTWKSETVGTYADDADLTYTAKVEAGDIYKDLNLSDAIAVKDVKIYVDGDEYTGANLVAIKKGSDAKVGDSGNGVLTEVFYDDGDNSVIITMVNTYVGQISKSVAATSKKDAYVVIDTLGAGPVGGTLEFETEVKIDDDTYVLYTYAKGDADAVKSVAVAESVSGTVTKVVNGLLTLGAEVIYENMYDTHVSGHACQEELKIIHALTKPRFFVPLHGEQRMLQIHCQLAQQMGMDRNHIAIADNGGVIEITGKSMKLSANSVPAGEVYVDGSGVGDVGAVVMRDRKRLAEDGMVVVVLPIATQDGALLSPPEIITRGFIYVKESGDLMKELQNVAMNAADSVTGSRKRGRDDGELRGAVKSAVSSYLFKNTKRSPMVIPVVTRL